MPRLPDLNPAKLEPNQREFYNNIISGPRGKFGGPFYALIHAPSVADQVQALGAALRFETTLDPLLREIAILVVGKHWRSEVEWNAHVVIALGEGVVASTIKEIQHGRLPLSAPRNQQLIYRFCMALLETKQIPDNIYQEITELVGIEQLVELVSLVGYFGLLAMLLNAFEIAADPVDGEPPAELLLKPTSPEST